MILRVDHFAGRFEKIALAITGITQSNSLSSGSSTSAGNSLTNNNYKDTKINLQGTLSKAREKADLQPLHKDSSSPFRPADTKTSLKMNNKQNYLGHIEDKRITFHHLRNR